MQGSWWKDRKDLDDDQEKVIVLEPNGNHILIGPPGCGKTNLLLLRAKYLSGGGKKNILFLTFGRTLAEFIKTGVGPKKLIDSDEIMTFRFWTKKTLGDLNPSILMQEPEGDFEETRDWYVEALLTATKELSKNYYDAIFVDEVQDLTESELRILSQLTPRLNVAGDQRQRIFNGHGIHAALALGCQKFELSYHYRVGLAICQVADQILPPMDGAKPLAQTSHYPEKKNPSSASAVPCVDFSDQMNQMMTLIRTQLKAFVGEAIGVFLPSFKNGVLDQMRQHFAGTDLNDIVSYHTSENRVFEEGKRIFVMTCHSAKGTEFRAVHVLNADRLVGNLGKRTLVFTAFTRAKTSLRVYHTARLPPFIASAFAKQTVPDIDDIF